MIPHEVAALGRYDTRRLSYSDMTHVDRFRASLCLKNTGIESQKYINANTSAMSEDAPFNMISSVQRNGLGKAGPGPFAGQKTELYVSEVFR